MIRKLTQADHDNVYDYLAQEAALNLFMIGDIEAFGYDSDFQELWGEFDQSANLKAVLLRYYNSFIPYATGDFNLDGFVSIIKDYDYTFSGKSDIVELFEQHGSLTLGTKRELYFCELTSSEKLVKVSKDLAIKKATIDDVDRIIELRNTIQEFDPTNHAKEMLIKSMESGVSRTYYYELNGEMVACASTTAENSLSAMIVGVCTESNHRRKGYASLCMNVLCRELLAENKSLCLFYDNPQAGKIYKRLGFKDIGMWTMYR